MAKLPANADKQPTLRVVPYPKDTNTVGDIFGGWIMSQVDIAGSIEAYRRTQCTVVTVAVNAFSFNKPVFVGDVVSLYTEVVAVGNTSVTISVDVFAERGWSKPEYVGEYVKVTEARLTYVAIDENRQPRSIVK